MYFPIWNLPMHLRGSSMLQCYFKYFLGAYPREMNMQDMHILRKYDSHANVLANFNYDNPYAAIFYCSKYLKYANGLLIHMPRLSIHRCLLCWLVEAVHKQQQWIFADHGGEESV